MSEDVEPEVIKKTQDILGKHIKKPQLTEKLLKKPPFRFLHDIVNNVITETGFLRGLFTESELNHGNIKDRDGKVMFLDKLISCVRTATGAPLAVKPTKIVAGLEPTRTNELLQAIGQGIDKKIDTSSVVEDFLKKGSKKASGSETKKKEKSRKSGAAANDSDTSKRVMRESSSTNEKKQSEKKEALSSVRNLQRTQDKKSEKAVDEIDSKKRTSSKERTVKEKESPKTGWNAKARTKRGETTDKTNNKTLIKPKEELDQKRSEPEITDTKSELGKTGGIDTIQEKSQPQSTPVVETPNDDVSGELKNVPEQPQNVFEEQPVEIDIQPENVVKVDAEHRRPLSALGRRRPSAAGQIKQEGSKEENVEQHGAGVISSTLGSEMKEDRSKTETPLSTSQSPSRPPSSVAGPSRASSGGQPSGGATPIPLQRPRTRQGSARPGAPRFGNRGEVALVSEEEVKPSPVNLIVEAGVKNDEDEDENLVVLENTTNDSLKANIPQLDPEPIRPPSQQGHLVTQILETQKELETGSKAFQTENSGQKVEIDWEASRQRERRTALKEVQRLCESIQTVTKAAHPIGKLLDSLQEDVDSMQQEWEHWQNMQRTLEEQLLAEEALTVQSTVPLKEHLQQLQQAVLLQQDQLSASKANILANDHRIHKLLATGDSLSKMVYS